MNLFEAFENNNPSHQTVYGLLMFLYYEKGYYEDLEFYLEKIKISYSALKTFTQDHKSSLSDEKQYAESKHYYDVTTNGADPSERIFGKNLNNYMQVINRVKSQRNKYLPDYQYWDLFPLLLMKGFINVPFDQVGLTFGGQFYKEKGNRIVKDTDSSKMFSQYTINKLEEFQNRAGDDESTIEIDNPPGREVELNNILQSFNRKNLNNVLLTGEPGVGKTKIIEKLILELQEDTDTGVVNKELQILELRLNKILIGAGNKGDAEERLIKLTEALEQLPDLILILENLDILCDKNLGIAGASHILKPILKNGNIKVIATTTPKGFQKTISLDENFANLFDIVEVEPPIEKECYQMIKFSIEEMYKEEKLIVSGSIIAEAYNASKRYLKETALPGSAISLIDRAVSAKKVNAKNNAVLNGEELTKNDLYVAVSALTGIPAGKLGEDDLEKLKNIKKELQKKVVGQDHAIDIITNKLKAWRLKISQTKTIGAFFLLGPTGTGKTELSKALAATLFDDEKAFIRFDMSEFMEEHSAALLIGAPPGYVGYEAGGLLVNKIRQKPYSVVLFDEIEKAHHTVFDLFLQIMDEGQLHDKLGRVGDFSNALIIFTSNIAAEFIEKCYFKNNNIGDIDLKGLIENLKQDYWIKKEKQLKPEFIARLSAIVPFCPLTDEMKINIFLMSLSTLKNSLYLNYTINLSISKESILELISQTENSLGARAIKNIIDVEIANIIADFLISKSQNNIKEIEIVFIDNKLQIKSTINTI